jgi:regulator of protease activity HflC (stomatin/prohibitin superfamily)
MEAVWISLVGVVVLAIAVWVVLIETSIRVEPGTLALLLKRGKATGRALTPGRHFIQPWRKVMVQVYPSRELALLAGGSSSGDPRVDVADEPLPVHLGDKTYVQLSFTVRCQLDTGKLKDVHNQFGPEGIWSALRDTTRRTLIAEAGHSDVTVDDAFGERYTALERRFTEALTGALKNIGFELRMFSLRRIDLGDTGEVIQSTLRADAELQREQALAKVRKARLENDRSMRELLDDVDGDVMLRYRQIEVLSQILQRWGGDRPIPAAITAPLTSPPSSTTSTTSASDAVVADADAEIDVASDEP